MNDNNSPRWYDGLDEPGLPKPNQREAIVTSWVGTLDEVRAYLPNNYEADEVIVTESTPNTQQQVRILIHGRDVGGWTLDGYVIPRLASGLIFAEEVSE